MTEGYIRFNCSWQAVECPIAATICDEFNRERSRLVKLGLIGMYPDGIGYGNISVRTKNSQAFTITGSATGKYTKLEKRHFAWVSAYSFENNSVFCAGLTRASAESLSHAAVYQAVPEAGAVVHVHCLWLWKKLVNQFPTTSAEIEYGTPEMAFQIGNLAAEMRKTGQSVIIMGGHREGILTFGKNLMDATNKIIQIFNQYKHD